MKGSRRFTMLSLAMATALLMVASGALAEPAEPTPSGDYRELRSDYVRTWYVYSDDDAWRDLMWYHLLMREVDDHYEAVLGGKIPDAFLVEVGDVAQGVPGYVSSLPYKLTDAPVVERRSRGSLPRLWERGE